MDDLTLIIQPDEDEGEGAEVLVDGFVDGRPYRFLLDSGAARSSIVADAYTSALPVLDSQHSSGVFAAAHSDLITVPSIEVGSIAKTNFTLVRATSQERRSLIGMDLLKDFCCHFRFDEQRVSLNADPADRDGAWRALYLDAKFHPYVDVLVGTAAAQAVWDTGASITIVDLNFVQAHPDLFEAAGHSTGTDSTGAQVQTPSFTMAATRIGGHDFPPLRVAGVDLAAVNATLEVPMDLILGYTTLSGAHWLFDFPNRRWMITQRLAH